MALKWDIFCIFCHTVKKMDALPDHGKVSNNEVN